MKKFWVLAIVFSSALLWGCGASKEGGSPLRRWMEEEKKLRILATTEQIGDLASGVGGDRVAVLALIRGDLNPHSYTLVKGDGEKLARADLVLSNGLGLEHGASLSEALKGNPKALAIGESIQKRHPREILYANGEVDPHVWMDVSLWSKGIDPIVERLSALDPEGASFYAARGEALRKEMEKAHEELKGILQAVPEEKRYLVTSHDAFQYFTRAYLRAPGERDWTERFAAPEGLAPDGQLNPRDLQGILDFLQERKITVLFPESNVHPDSIRKVASAGREMGLSLSVCERALFGDAMGGNPYLVAMRLNAELLAEELGRQ